MTSGPSGEACARRSQLAAGLRCTRMLAGLSGRELARAAGQPVHRVSGDFFDDVSSGEDALEKAVPAMRFLPQRTPYGQVFAYQNSNYIIAGRLIQAVRRAKSRKQCVKEELLAALGMSHTSFFMPELQAGRFAAGHGAVFDATSRPKVSFSALPRAAYPADGERPTVCVSDRGGFHGVGIRPSK